MRFWRIVPVAIVAPWATIWATYDTARLVGLLRDGPAGYAAWPSARWRGLALVL
jgi:hypothetical protein